MYKKIKNLGSRDAGFTLIEGLLAFFILTLGVLGSYAVVSRNLSVAVGIKNELIAVQIAEEGTEVVRNIRDNDWHAGSVFGASIPDGTWRVQWNSTTLLAVASTPLKLDSASGLYSYDSGTDTLFSRAVTISTPAGEGAIRRIVTINVTWKERGVSKSVQAEEHLYNWKQQKQF